MRIFSFFLAIIATAVFGYQDEYAKIAHEQQANFDFAVIAQEIMDSIEEGDTSVIEGYMCKNIKDNVVDLPGEIKKLMDAIPGEITSWEPDTTSHYSRQAQDGNGGNLLIKDNYIYIYTTQGNCRLEFEWEIVNTIYPEETGIRKMYLFEFKWSDDGSNAIRTNELGSICQTEQAPYSNPNPPTVREDNKKMIEYIISCLKGTA